MFQKVSIVTWIMFKKYQKLVYVCVCVCLYIYICNYIYIRTGVLPGEVRFDCARPMFFAFWDVGRMADEICF